jgi:hypothetical protein
MKQSPGAGLPNRSGQRLGRSCADKSLEPHAHDVPPKNWARAFPGRPAGRNAISGGMRLPSQVARSIGCSNSFSASKSLAAAPLAELLGRHRGLLAKRAKCDGRQSRGRRKSRGWLARSPAGASAPPRARAAAKRPRSPWFGAKFQLRQRTISRLRDLWPWAKRPAGCPMPETTLRK